MGAPLLRAGAQGERRGAGTALDDAAGRRVHPFLQRRALAVRGHHPVAARAGARARARPAADGGTGRDRQPARSAHRPCADDRALQRLFRPRPRRLRRARPYRAREPLQRRERHLSRTEHAAGLLPLQHVDARSRVGDARIRRAARVPGHASADAPDTSMLLDAAIATCDHYIDEATAADGIPYWDAGAPGLAQMPDWRDRAADPFNDHEPVDSSAAAIASQGLLRLARVLADRRAPGRSGPLPAGRPARRRNAVRRERPVSEHRSEAPGPAAPLRLSLAEQLGSRAGRCARRRAANRASGATITRAKWRSTSNASPRAGPTWPSSDNDAHRRARRSSPEARAASASASRARWRGTDGTSRSAACGPRRRRARRSTSCARSAPR